MNLTCVNRGRLLLPELVKSRGDHLVTYPTLIIRRWDEAVVLGFIQVSSLWGARPWRVSDPRAHRDAIGVGAFNLVKRSAYEQVGGFEALRMEVVEDLALGRSIAQIGFLELPHVAIGAVPGGEPLGARSGRRPAFAPAVDRPSQH